jgi:hypothetical protein
MIFLSYRGMGVTGLMMAMGLDLRRLEPVLHSLPGVSLFLNEMLDSAPNPLSQLLLFQFSRGNFAVHRHQRA